MLVESFSRRSTWCSQSHDVVEPDLVFVAGDQTDILTEANIQGPPAIVIEIVSKSTRSRDERIKKEFFDRGGVREYWMVDPDRNQLIVHLRERSTDFTHAPHFPP